jgi:hypothetical protein
MNDKDSKLIQEAYQKIQEAQFTSSGIKKTWGSDKGDKPIEYPEIDVDGIQYKVNGRYDIDHQYDSGSENDPSYSEVYVKLIDPVITYESETGEVKEITFEQQPELYQKIKDEKEKELEEYEEYLLS